MTMDYFFGSKMYIYNNKLVISFNKVKWLYNLIYNNMKEYISFIFMNKDMINLYVYKDTVWFVLQFLKNNLFIMCNQLLDLTVVDSLELESSSLVRFEFVYVLLSTVYNMRIFVSGFLALFEGLFSVVNIYSSVEWLESEMWDLYGVFIYNHLNLRRILTDYGFLGFPFSKDFPLTGYVELSYDEITKSMIMEPLELMQEFSFFNLEMPWKMI